MGIVTEQKGSNLPKKEATCDLTANKINDCVFDVDSALGRLSEELQAVAPDCIINSLNWSFSKNYSAGKTEVKANGKVGGIDS